MKFVIILSIFSLAAIAGISATVEVEDIALRRWNEFKLKYNKTYPRPGEEAERLDLFFRSLRRVVDHNFDTSTVRGYRRGVNHLSDLKYSEYKSLLGLKMKDNSNLRVISKCEPNFCRYTSGPAPDSKDWRQTYGVVGPVKDQKNCGSCWSFTITGLLEGQERLNSTGGVVPLSEQNLIDCSKKNHGCNGGDFGLALEFIKSEGGLETESDYPYLSERGKDNFNCKFENSKAFVTTMYLGESVMVQEGNEEALKEVVAAYGPVAAGMDATDVSFSEYQSGVYYNPECSKNVNHAVLIVGYGTTDAGEDYWIIKNSWGENWGMSGYGYIARNKNNHCGIASVATLSFSSQQS